MIMIMTMTMTMTMIIIIIIIIIITYRTEKKIGENAQKNVTLGCKF